MMNPPGGLPPWLQVLPPWITLPYTAIQQIIKDFTSGVLPATEAPTDLPKPGFSPLPPGMQEKPGFTPLPLELQHEKPGFTPLPPEMMPTVDRGPQAPPRFPIPGTTPLPPEMQGGGVRAADDDAEDPLSELEGEWRDPRALPYPPGFFAEREGGSYDPQWDAESLAAGTRPYDKYQDRTSRVMDSEYRYHTGFNPYFDTEGEPWTEGAPGDPTQVLTPGTAQWKEKQALDRRDDLIAQARALEEKWGLPVTIEMDKIQDDLESAKQWEIDENNPDASASPEQKFVDRWAQDANTTQIEAVNDRWAQEIEEVEGGAEFVDQMGSLEYLEQRYPDVDFDALRTSEVGDLPDALRGLSSYIDGYYKEGRNFQDDFRTYARNFGVNDPDISSDMARGFTDHDWGGTALSKDGASPRQQNIVNMYYTSLEARLPADARIGEHGQIIPGETPIDQILLDLHDEIMNEDNEFSDMA